MFSYSIKIFFFEFVIVEDKFKAIIKLKFSTSLHQLETYFDLIEWLREYISHYADIFKSLQDRKIELLRFESIVDETRRAYVVKIRVRNSTKKKKTAFATLQSLFFKFFFLIHLNIKRQLFINLNVSKKFDFEIMIYHVKAIWNDKNCFSRNSIESIFFFNRLLSSIEIRYWFIELKLIDVVWVLKKVRHMIEAYDNFLSIVIYIDHELTLNIVKQITLIINFIDKLNFRFVKISNYLQKFNLNIKHKFDKQHIVSNAFFRLANANTKQLLWKSFTKAEKNVLDVLFTVSLIEMNFAFREKILIEYKTNFNWQKISVILNAEVENDFFFSSYRKNDLIFRKNEFSFYNTIRFCISHFVIKNVLKLIHNEKHVDYSCCYNKISFSYYIRELFKYFRDYLKYCSNCLMYQTKRHRFYNSL